MGEVVLALLGRQREIGGERCWFLIDLSTLQRNSVGPVYAVYSWDRAWNRDSGDVDTRASRRDKRRAQDTAEAVRNPRLIWWPVSCISSGSQC